jgi:hypothetical protein
MLLFCLQFLAAVMASMALMIPLAKAGEITNRSLVLLAACC